MDKNNIIEVYSREVHCDDDHPLVYYVIPTETNQAVCGYCNRTFVYVGDWMDKETKKQLDAIEKTVYRIEQDTIKIRKELKEHIEEIWAVYKPLKKILKIFKKDE